MFQSRDIQIQNRYCSNTGCCIRRTLNKLCCRQWQFVCGDQDRLRQVVDNLLANVRAHTPAGAAARVRVWSDAGELRAQLAKWREETRSD